ncbi:MAG: peptidylprolyl isomerase [Bacteroidales bacterium]|nr:peptidylprolyl isomerase [Bacteroidales bacterium]
MIKKFCFVIFIGAMTILSLSAQNQKDFSKDQRVLMTIGKHPITVSEYMAVYAKNNVGNIIDKKTPEDYLNLYVDFKLKVFEAEEQGLDTSASFKSELEGYRKQLSAPYFDNKEAEQQLLEEAYRHMQEDLRVSHILVMCDEFADPKDTLIAWKKIEKLRKRVLKGEDFNQVAWESSEDPSARDREAQGSRPALTGNRGDLGYFTAFNMIYSFEKAAYATPLNNISPIIRTTIGYHLLKVTERRSAMGKATVAHIFFKTEPTFTQKQQDSVLAKANNAYNLLKKGEKWSTVLTMSDDENSKNSGGVLPPFTVSRMVPEFITAVREINNSGDFSAPVKTSFGYHIIRLDKIEPIPSFADAKESILKRIKNDMRAQNINEAVINDIKKEYGFKEFPNTLPPFLAVCDTVSMNAAQWNPSAAAALQYDMFQIGDSTLTVQDFARYVAQKQTPHLGGMRKDMISKINRYFKMWEEETCKTFADQHLAEKYPEYKYLLQEYSDGMLLFEIMEQEVWNKSMTDSVGLAAFYETQKDQYMWGDRRDYTEVNLSAFSDEKATKKTADQLVKKIAKGVDYATLQSEYEAMGLKFMMYNKKVEKGVNPFIDSLWMEPAGAVKIVQQMPKSVKIIKINEYVAPETKSLKNVRGAITAAYQDVLEKNWLQSLRKKFPVIINQDVFKDLK